MVSLQAETVTGMKCFRFGVFEVDPQARELRKGGVRIKLENQPFEILEALLENPGQIVTRGELQRRLWDEGTFVDFERSLTKAVNKLRMALSDSAATPRFIETLSRRGYRFLAPVAVLGDQPPVAAAEEPARPDSGDGLAAAGTPESAKPGRWRWLQRWPLLAIAGLLAAVVTLSVGSRGVWPRGFLGMPRIESLAVLPIENLTGDERQEYLADELTDELINHLSMIGSLRVISRTSAMRYKAARKALPEIARELRVDGVLEGSLQRPMDRLRINIRLMHAPADRQLWADTYEGAANDAVGLLRQITVAIAHEISARLTAEDSSRLFGQRPRNPVAYDAYLHG
jgi:TolB-like protein/DNA-binding winged helix-turn-helix (wHTH) protein